MAEFKYAYPTIARHEGGYSNHPADRGGESYAGISRVHWPEWYGWQTIDKARTGGGFPTCLKHLAGLADAVRYFYQQQFWQYDPVEDQAIATWLLDRAVNCGTFATVKMLQKVLSVEVDGKFGPQTIAAVNAADPVELREQLREAAKDYYQAIVEADPSQACFLSGWLKRC